MLTLKNLQKNYEDKKDVVKNVNLTIPDGTIFGLVGVDGAGKTTLLRLMAGILRQDEGLVCVDGDEVYENIAAKQRIFFLSEEPFYHRSMTIQGLAERYSSLYPFDKEIFDSYLDKFKLTSKTLLKNCSKGVRKQVFLSLAFAIEPKYLLLDEAFNGLDTFAQIILKEGLKELACQKNSVIVLSSRSLRELQDFCDSYGVLQQGELTCSGDLSGDLSGLHKFQAAFDRAISEGDIPFSCVSFSQSGKVVRLVAKGNAEELKMIIEQMQPIFVEEIELELEELFLGEARLRGYLK
jgi:ABC-2 type transport system ATP-binding protein